MAGLSSRATCFSCAVLGYFCLLCLLWICTQLHSPAPCLVSFLLRHDVVLLLFSTSNWCFKVIFSDDRRGACYVMPLVCHWRHFTGLVSPWVAKVCLCVFLHLNWDLRDVCHVKCSKGVRSVCVFVCCCRCLDEFEESVWFPIGYLHSVCVRDVPRDTGSACFCVCVKGALKEGDVFVCSCICMCPSEGFSLDLLGSLQTDCSLCVCPLSVSFREYYQTSHVFISPLLRYRYHISKAHHMRKLACHPVPSSEKTQGCRGDRDACGRFWESEATLPWQSLGKGRTAL